METPELTAFIRRNIRLKNNVHLIFDSEDGVWRIALYRPRKPDEVGYEVDAAQHELNNRTGCLPKHHREYWCRHTLKTNRLKEGIQHLCYTSGNGHHFNDLWHYILSTEWGKDLGS